MKIMGKMRGLFAAPLFAIAGLVSVSAPNTAGATPIATAFIDGQFSLVTPGSTFGTEFDIAGNFGGTVSTPPPYGAGIYRFSASFALNGAGIFSASTDQVLSLAEIGDILTLGASVAAFVGSNSGVTATIPGPFGSTLGTAEYNVLTYIGGFPTVSGTYDVDVNINAPIGPLVNSGIQQVLNVFNLPPSALGGFTFPSSTSGEFRFDFAVAAVPVPATLPMLFAGGLMLAAIKRRKTRAMRA